MAKTRTAAAVGLALAMLGAAFGAAAQTPGQIQDPSSYQGSMELQRQEQAQAQQQAQQNTQAQQRLDQNYRAYAPGGGGRAAGPPPIDWWKKPPLDPAHNPLLGRWKQSAPPKAPQIDGVAGMLPGVNVFLAGAFAGGCDSIFGKGITAFEPDALMWVAPDGHEEILNHIAYRANGNDIIVLTRDPGAIPALIFALPNHDHAVVAFLGCSLARQGVRPPTASTPANTAPAPRAGAPQPGTGQSSTQAILSFQVATSAPEEVSPMPGGRVWVSRGPPEANLAGGSGSAADRLAADCGDVAACDRDINAFTKGALGFATVDAQGHTQTPPLAPGLYYLLGVAPWRGHVFAWSFAVVLKPGGTTVALSQLNARRLK